MSRYPISKTYTAVASYIMILAVLISNIEVSAQPYQRSVVLDNNIEFNFAEVGDNRIHYAASGDRQKPGVLFIHGTPGGWDAFEIYLQSQPLKEDFFMVSVDRIGWGDSPLEPELINGEFSLQALAIKAVIDQYPSKKWTLVGHSLGASLAPKVALYAADSVDSLILLAGSLNPSLGKPRWYNWAANTWLIASLIGNSMKYSNREIMGLRKQLELMDSELRQAQLDANILVIQGMKDKLVSPKNAAYPAQQWQSTFNAIEVIELVDEGHFLPWRQTPLVVQSIYKIRAARQQP
ncbi:MAG: pimeloyl-ACP methyl ester carboxylesterase [Arenicella sp.]|jgi:pimeloyl-ACP methyl ester carboxylesterase